MDTGSLLTSRHIKENQSKHHKVFADFLPRIPQQGWASEAKPIPTTNKRTAEIEKKRNGSVQYFVRLHLGRTRFI